MALGLKFFLVFVAIFFLGCTHGNCRKKGDMPPYPGQAKNKSNNESDANNLQLDPVDQRVVVYKYDGSLQCGQSQGASLAKMEKELDGIKVFLKAKKPDGLMHIQVCGSKTGMTNTYEILKKDLPTALKNGFKVWKFN